MKKSYEITQKGNDSYVLIDRTKDKIHAFKKARVLAVGNKDQIRVEWHNGEKLVICAFDPYGDWRKIR